MKGCNVCLTSKAVWYKLYGDLQSLPVPTHCWKNLMIDFAMDLSILTDWKRDNYDWILVIVNWLTKIVYYEPVKVTINALRLGEIIINVVVRHYTLLDSILTDRGLLFISKFWSSLCYFLSITSGGYPPPFIYRQMARLRSKIVQWKPITKPLSTLSKMIGHVFSPWRSLSTTMLQTPTPATYLSRSITDIIFAFSMKKILIPTQN